MCQGEIENLCKASQSCNVRKVARLLARPLSQGVEASQGPNPHSCPYSPNLVEGLFSGVQVQDPACPRSYRGPMARSWRREAHKTKLHVVVVHKNSRI
jgi:hypothetical protein